jgi:hypothetical protein
MFSQEKIINSLKNYENYGDLLSIKELYYYIANTVGIFVDLLDI